MGEEATPPPWGGPGSHFGGRLGLAMGGLPAAPIPVSVQGTPKPLGLVPLRPAAEWKRAPEAPSPSSSSEQAAYQTLLPCPAGASPRQHPSLDTRPVTQQHNHHRNGPGQDWVPAWHCHHPSFTAAAASCSPTPAPLLCALRELPVPRLLSRGPALCLTVLCCSASPGSCSSHTSHPRLIATIQISAPRAPLRELFPGLPPLCHFAHLFSSSPRHDLKLFCFCISSSVSLALKYVL